MLDLTPDDFRALGYRAIDIIAERLAALPDAPTRQPVPDALREELMRAPLPEHGTDAADLLEMVAERVLPYPMGNSSPRFFAWVNSPPAPLAFLADLFAAANGASVAGGDHAATYVEHGVLGWMKQIMRFPESSGAILTSGGSMANLIPLAVMRHVKAQGNIRTDGFTNETAPMVVYTSSQGHTCIQKAVELLGMGSNYLRKIPVDADYRMDMDALRQQIADDRAAGLRPVCVAASAGTVNTGALDPFDTIADLCEAEELWFHVDGAYGGFGILSEQAGALYAGIERADSIAIDPHKWLYMPVECGCALVKDKQAMRDAFSLVAPYLRNDAALPWFSEFGPQQTRGFKALKLWMTIQQIGVQGYRDLITRDIALAQYLQARLREREDFELVAAGPLSVTCFRYTPPGATDITSLNRRLLEIVQREGDTFLISTELDGQLVLRVCIINYRTQREDIDLLLDTLANAGQRVLAEGAKV